jgi:hypothetical protein
METVIIVLALLGIASLLAVAVLCDTMTNEDRRKAGFKD